MDDFKLTEAERHRLIATLHHTHDVRLYRRTLAILECARGKGMVEVAETLNMTRQSIYNWVTRYRRTREIDELTDAPKSGRPPFGGKALDPLIKALMVAKPERLGYDSSYWTVPLLQDQVWQRLGERCSAAIVKRSLRRLGYRWKRPCFILASDSRREFKRAD